MSILPFSYHYFHKKYNEVRNYKTSNFALNSLIGIIAIYSFLADTNPEQEIKVKIKSEKEFKINISKKQILDSLVISKQTNISETDSLFSIYFHIPEYRANATAKIRIIKVDKENTIIKFDSITEVSVVGRLFFGFSQSDIDGCKEMTHIEYEENFKANFIDIITNIRETEYSIYYAEKRE